MSSPSRQSGFIVGGLLILSVLFFLLFLSLPAHNFEPVTTEIPRGYSISQAADRLDNQGVVLSDKLLEIPLVLREQSITAGTYRFISPQNPLTVARRLAIGDFQAEQTQVTIPGGLTREQIANLLAKNLGPRFSQQKFLRLTEGEEGRLMPDTYTFAPNTTTKKVAEKIRQNFRAKIKKLQPQFDEFEHTREQALIMASLVSGEAARYNVRRRVAGVLWNRYEQEMPLQVDAVFPYIMGKNTYELTEKDLQVESPYNVYETIGLPPTPISNPSFSAIKATINPTETDHLYYLTGDSGKFYFSEQLKDHKRYKRQYIRK